ncbi:inner membrane protein PPF-1, chloroplastic [Gossypium australe]|uniref:Inner membrane protein PPF-1, chloroplastic n=1 Tax=Gossypium australe TaxID=47621 RepID=A0A5B6X9Q0_9ROSI|nr:inner membrane protein PPF-1, chloroplastic [Gossypium australe]
MPAQELLVVLKDGLSALDVSYANRCKQAGINSQAGCFPPLASIPVWICLFQALSNVANEVNLLIRDNPLVVPENLLIYQRFKATVSVSPLIAMDEKQCHAECSSTIGRHTVAYLVLPVLPVVFLIVSMELMKPSSFHQGDEALDEAYASSASNRNLGVVDSCAFIASSDMI